MTIHLRPATLVDVAFLADAVILATLAQGRFHLMLISSNTGPD